MQWECDVFLVSVNDVGQTFVVVSSSGNMMGKMLTFLCAQHGAVRRRRGRPRVVVDSIALM